MPIRLKIEELESPNWLKQKYSREGLTTRELGKLLGCSKTTVRNRLKEFDILRRPSRLRGWVEGPRSGWIPWNEHFFDESSPDGLYMLGFLVADGYILDQINKLRGDSRVHQFGFLQVETAILKKIAVHLEFEGELGDGGNSPCASLKLGSKHAWHLLTEKYEIPAGGRKSYEARIPSVILEDPGLPHFMRGLFDGDGGADIPRFAFWSGSPDLADDFSRVLADELGIPQHPRVWEKGNYIKKDGTQSGCWRVRWSSPYDAMQFAKYIYGPERDVWGSDLYLARKKERFDQLFVPWRDRDYLYQKYVVEGKSPGRIAADLPDVTGNTIGTWISIHGLRQARSKHWNLELGI